MSFLIGALYVLFVISCILLIVVILLQEGKGGGLGEAFGGVGGETFGHRAGGVNKFTAMLAGVMMVTAIVINAMSKPDTGSFIERPSVDAPPVGPVSPPGPPSKG